MIQYSFRIGCFGVFLLRSGGQITVFTQNGHAVNKNYRFLNFFFFLYFQPLFILFCICFGIKIFILISPSLGRLFGFFLVYHNFQVDTLIYIHQKLQLAFTYGCEKLFRPSFFGISVSLIMNLVFSPLGN